jgi:uncharacterized protein YbaP (TraB family)
MGIARFASIGAALALAFLLGTSPAIQVEPRAEPRERHFLWRVKSSSATVYLAGSIHLLKREHDPLPRAFEEAFGAASSVVFELDLGSAEPAAAASLILSRGSRRDGRTLRGILSPEEYEEIAAKSRAMGLEPRQLDGLKPWLVALTLASARLKALGFSAEHGMDRHFFGKARSQGKRVLALETVEEQVGFLDGLPEDVQIAYLMKTARELELVEKNFEALLRAWRRGDPAALESLLAPPLERYPVVRERLLSQRNLRWVEKIEGLLEGKETSLVVVGAGHLVGRGGLLELLERRGYAVEQL